MLAGLGRYNFSCNISSKPSTSDIIWFCRFSFASLPPAVKRRIKALKNYQVKQIQLEAKFYEEVHQLECKYAKLYEECYDKVSSQTEAQTV